MSESKEILLAIIQSVEQTKQTIINLLANSNGTKTQKNEYTVTLLGKLIECDQTLASLASKIEVANLPSKEGKGEADNPESKLTFKEFSDISKKEAESRLTPQERPPVPNNSTPFMEQQFIQDMMDNGMQVVSDIAAGKSPFSPRNRSTIHGHENPWEENNYSPNVNPSAPLQPSTPPPPTNTQQFDWGKGGNPLNRLRE